MCLYVIANKWEWTRNYLCPCARFWAVSSVSSSIGSVQVAPMNCSCQEYKKCVPLHQTQTIIPYRFNPLVIYITAAATDPLSDDIHIHSRYYSTSNPVLPYFHGNTNVNTYYAASRTAYFELWVPVMQTTGTNKPFPQSNDITFRPMLKQNPPFPLKPG